VSREAPASARADLAADLERYPRRPWLREQSVYSVAVYRFGRWTDAAGGWRGALGRRAYWPLYRVVETLTGISLPKAAEIGPGLRIWHFGGIVVHDDARIGARCTLRQGVTIGNRVDGGPVPTVGDDVEIGAYAQVLGGITVGDGARIGAMAVVLADVPPGATAVGNPARVLPAPEAAGAPPLG
jgi:serine O-acetyltransferase